MGYEPSGCDAIISGLGAKVQRGKGSKVFVEAHCCASPQSLVDLISQNHTVCHFDRREKSHEGFDKDWRRSVWSF